MGNFNAGAMAVRDTTIAQESLIPGTTYNDLAAKFGISKSQICRVLQKPHIQDIINTAQQNLIAFTPLAIEKFLTILKDSDHSDHYKAIRDQLQTMGILASHTGGNTYIQNIYNTANIPETKDINRFTELIAERQEQDVIEAEYENVDP